MAKVILKDLKKVYPNTEKKKKVKKGEEPQEKKSNLQITDEGVVAVQQFSLDALCIYGQVTNIRPEEIQADNV